MRLLLTGVWVYTPEGFKKEDIAVVDGRVIGGFGPNIGDGKVREADKIQTDTDISFERVIKFDNSFILPGLCDVHVHLREPGYEYKETIASGSRAGARGGYTCICAMPNLKPSPTDMTSLQKQLDIIKRDAVIDVIPYGRITSDNTSDQGLADMADMASSVIAFSDDGNGVADIELMEAAMRKAASLGKVIVAHCEDMNYPSDDPRREWKQVERDLRLCEMTGCSYHVCHLSAKESVKLIRAAKSRGVDVTCETAPHYLVFNNETVRKNIVNNCGGRFKMNPPIRSEGDRQALIEGLQDGTIDMIATDHAPHSMQEKSRGFRESLYGVVGLETAFPVLYTELVEKNIISFEKLVEIMATNPRKRFNLVDTCGLTVIDLEEEFEIDPQKFESKGRSTPFEGMKVRGQVLITIANGKIVWEK